MCCVCLCTLHCVSVVEYYTYHKQIQGFEKREDLSTFVLCSFQTQKLLQFLKLQEEEKDRLSCQNLTISHSRASEDTHR